MTDRLFRSMGSDRTANERLLLELFGNRGPAETCPRCGTLYYAGDWPWCGDEGPEGHKR